VNDIPAADERERRLIDAVVSLAKSFREERDRLARRLSELEREIDALAVRLDQHQREVAGTELPAGARSAPSRTRS
jgi:predicted RNase H-like nuclease (RuvC/YqgF family)